MKYVIVILCIFLHITSFSQPVSYKEWQREAKLDDRLLPEYGGKPRTAAQKTEDENYIKTTMQEMNASRHDCSQQLVELGFKYLGNGDLRVAMYRFNQAWIMDPKNADVYSGFGTVYFILQDLKKSLQYFNKGLKIDPKNTNLLTYSARSYVSLFETTKTDTTSFFKALPLLNKSFAIDPKNSYTTFMLSRYYARLNNCDSAVKYYKLCKKSGGQPLTEQYTSALNKICGPLMK